ncbi:MAG: hypothetical protein C4527_07490 [Candidatus Omnitrophota bacterium]|jgi:hypothetical protein|nr:MAG: hypothetical protein C4527_07490 [Candidatus Omnitrophota bacterium]
MSTKILPEEQPRYIIDEGMPHEESDAKILPEEQERILHKLLKAAGHMLTGEERDLIFRLQDKLKHETDRIRSLKKVTVSDKPLDFYLSKMNKKSNNKANSTVQTVEDGEEEQPVAVRRSFHVVGFKPEEVVKRYIECWNQQKFGAEFDCFSRDFLTTDRETYVSARHLFYQQQLSQGGMNIDLNEIVSSDTFGGDAEVVASKVVQTGHRKPQEETDLYRLKLERGRWLIYAVEPC